MITISFLFMEGGSRLLAAGLGAGGILVSIGLLYSIGRNVDRGLKQIKEISQDIAADRLNPAAAATVRTDEFGQLAASFFRLAADLHHRTADERELRLRAEEQAWINTQVSEMALLLQGSVQLRTASRVFIGRLATAVGGSYGAVYLKQGGQLNFAAGYAFDDSAGQQESIPLGSGLVGQCALDGQMIVLQDLPEHYIKVRSSLGEAAPASLIIVPIKHEQEIVAVMELAALRPFSSKEMQLIERTGQNMGVLINTLADVARIEDLLSETQLQKDELEAQTEELTAQTQELEAQTEELMAQTEELRLQTDQLQDQKTELEAQSESLLTSNEQLQTQMKLTEAQKDEIEAQTEELRQQTEELHASNLELQNQMEISRRQTMEIKAQADEISAANRDMQKQLQITEMQKSEIADQAEELQAQTSELLEQKEQLQAQTEELQSQTEELQAQTDTLQTQADELLIQKEELAASHDQLLLQVELTEKQKEEIQAQAQEIFMAAQYKSEFLANVSHELRTPLNSLLILSQILAENKDGNLEAKQLEYVHTIFSAGKDLLQLIDEILDLAKLEVGKMTPVIEPVSPQDLSNHVFRHFEQQAKKKNLRFDVHSDNRLPDYLMTDGHRLQQVLNNLLSNAIKFTPEQGSVSLSIRTSGEEAIFAVSDTGIGIAASKLESIFEAFQQADGTTSRKYGGTGLGLTICRELATLLGGRIEVDSVEGKGSTFSLIIPAVEPGEDAQTLAAAAYSAAASPEIPASEPIRRENPAFRESFVPDISISNPKLLQYAEMDDDRSNLLSGDITLLIIEEDAEFAARLLELARSRGFKAIVAFQGDQGLALAHAYKPDAILLDLHLPVLDGWSIISRLKSRPELRHIPVHVISTAEENQQSLSMGALSFWKKPNDYAELEAAFLQIETYIRRPVKSLLIVEDNKVLRGSLVEFIAHPDVNIIAVGTGREAMEHLASHHFDCMVLDLGLSDISGFDLLEQVKTNRKLQTLPVIIYTGKDLSKTDEQRLKHYAESIVIKNVRSMERLYDDTALYLHRKHADLPLDKQRLIENLHNPESAFAGKSILLVDDDMRNIFALSSVLEGYNMEISFAQNGREALEHLETHPGVELIFMDIMMPEMDGYETMKHIRLNPDYDQIVIIALTARALEEDRVKCLEAGASDYISKPINTTQLVRVLKLWLIQ
ncbi:multi-sensor hybrid histidine kinase [Paenibacillus sp. FSL R7-277]|uniref:response regulator n=1 Tax=Paenibacillus sp. FSL R7-277 TaxID=1227352 RepID=UPI0003E24689|nr:response regulator [Paenibacillus sp. FSL R7-277]ETT77000.1 multi-sensor hybrid histidine kinase [Paenibacillus sp. FSL R7-277]